MRLIIMKGEYSIFKLEKDGDMNLPVPEGFVSYTRTGEELSLVCRSGAVTGCLKEESGWRLLMVEGPLDFSMTGVISSISGPLAGAGISIFVISTFDTDYLLIKSDRVRDAARVLSENGFLVTGEGQ